MLVDRNARYTQRVPDFHPEKFFGQLENILEVQLPAIPNFHPDTLMPSVYFLAGIRRCDLEEVNALNMPYYTKTARYEVVDMTCVQCLVARIAEQHPVKRWAIADRSNNVDRSFYVEGE